MTLSPFSFLAEWEGWLVGGLILLSLLMKSELLNSTLSTIGFVAVLPPMVTTIVVPSAANLSPKLPVSESISWYLLALT